MFESRSLVLSFCIAASALVSNANAGNDVRTPTAAKSSAQDDVHVRVLDALMDEYWQDYLNDWPEQATFFGDYRGNDRWGDYSPQAVKRYESKASALLSRLYAIDDSGFDETNRANRKILIRLLEDDVAAYQHDVLLMPLDQFNGLHLILPIMIKAFPFDSSRHYHDYAARLDGVPRLLEQITDRARAGMAKGLMPPRYLLEKIVAQCEQIATPAGSNNVFSVPILSFPDSVPASEHEALRARVIEAVDTKVRPAYLKLASFVRDEYAPNGRDEAGIWALPDGEALYRSRIRQLASTDLAPEQIHQLGLSEVERIEREQGMIARQLGYADLAELRYAMKRDRKLYAHSREQILQLYRQYATQMEPRLPLLFGLLPKVPIEIVEVERHRENEASSAAYMAGTADGSRPGMLFVNTGNFQNRLLSSIEAIAYHEGIPGHHMQGSIARALPGLPKFRTLFNQMAYVEGWGLYSERLGKELGFYQDPYSDYGRLAQELARANRLVLDTGVHYKRWSREQMVAWFRLHFEPDEPYIQAEVDRYIAWPGQALAYKVGELKILELRRRAEIALGAQFDIRAFHDTVLGGGSMPLSVLEERVDAWIARSGQPTLTTHDNKSY